MKYSPHLALEVCQGIEKGHRSGASYSRLYGIDEKEISLWLAQYRLYGATVFDQEMIYTQQERKHIVEDKLKNALTLTETCLKYKILHRSSLRNWIRQYKNGRLEQMKAQNKPNKQKDTQEQSKTERIKELERELLYVRAENAYLKKLQALMQETKKN